MKGQYQILEQVMLFGIGLIILTSVFAIFNMLGERIGIGSKHDNFQEVSLFVASNVIELHEQGKYFHNATVKLFVPRTIGNEIYELSLNKNGVHSNSTISDIYKSVVGVYNINGTSIIMRGVELSTLSPLELFYSNTTRNLVLRR